LRLKNGSDNQTAAARNNTQSTADPSVQTAAYCVEYVPLAANHASKKTLTKQYPAALSIKQAATALNGPWILIIPIKLHNNRC